MADLYDIFRAQATSNPTPEQTEAALAAMRALQAGDDGLRMCFCGCNQWLPAEVVYNQAVRMDRP